MSSDEPKLIAYLQRALDSPEGTELTLPDIASVHLLRTKLYGVRRAHPEYAVLSFIQRGEKLFILKRQATYDDPFGSD